MTHQLILEDLRVLRIAGADRRSFLQGQLTQDVAQAEAATAILAGWADAKGRLLMIAWLYAGAEAFHLILPASLAGDIVRRLKMYVLRAKVTVEDSGLSVAGVTGEPRGEPPGHPELTVLRLPGATARWLLTGPAEQLSAMAITRSSNDVDGDHAVAADAAAWALADVRAGLPRIHPQTSGAFVPQMVNLDLLGGISFDKGCYTGQEIVARMHYRGRVRRRMLRFLSGSPAVDPGTAVLGERGTVGQVVTAAPAGNGCELLVVVCLDDLDQPLFLAGAPDSPLVPADLPYAIPELDSA